MSDQIYNKYIANMIVRTANDNIRWNRANPTTFTWDPSQTGPSERIQFVFQKVINPATTHGIFATVTTSPAPSDVFIFRVIRNGAVVVSLSTSDGDKELAVLLRDAYNLIEKKESDVGLTILRRILHE